MKRGRSASAPSYRLHAKSGQARVRINGKDFYLGPHGSPESQQAYKQVIADHWHPPGTAPKLRGAEPSAAITVSRLAIEFAKYAKQKHGETNEWVQIRLVLKTMRETYGHLAADEFGPVRFENYRQSLVDRNLSRLVVKRKANYVLKMFQRGVKLELIPVEIWQRLLAVGPLEARCKPAKKVLPVSDAVIEATQAELTPVLRDLVEVHRLIGARPSEVCNMRPCDIDRTADIWIYTPATHKTEHHGRTRKILIGPKAQAVLSRYLFRDPQAYCFTPSEG